MKNLQPLLDIIEQVKEYEVEKITRVGKEDENTW
jgi:hypothetical protein